MKYITFSITLFVLITQCLPGLGQNNYQLKKKWWITDDVVKTVLEYNGKVYIGGNFSYIGPDAPYGGCVDVVTEEADTNYLTPNGAVNAVIADGSGGWYIGGEFTFVGNTERKHIARLNSDGTLNPWNPGANNDVHALMLSGNLIYTGGTFTNIGSAPRNRIAALDTTTGLANSWNPDADAKVTCLAKNNNVIYAGGDFTTMGLQSRSYLAAIDSATGFLLGWNPSPNWFVNVIKIFNYKIYVGGWFTAIGGLNRKAIASLDISTGVPDAWDPNPTSTLTLPQVYDLDTTGNLIYVAGFYSNIGGLQRYGLAAVDKVTGNANTFNPSPRYNWNGSTIRTVKVIGNSVYYGGQFNHGNNMNFSHVFTNSNFSQPVINIDSKHSVLAAAWNGNKVYLGGTFTSIGGTKRVCIAQLDTATGKPTTNWNADCATTAGPGINPPYVNMIVPNGANLVVGGYFGNISGQTTFGMGVINISDGNPTSFQCDVSYDYSQASRFETAVVSGNTIYAGGLVWGAVSGVYKIATFNFTTGAMLSYHPTVTSPQLSPIKTMQLAGTVLYVGGQFSAIGGTTRNNIAAIDVSSNTVTAWNPNADSTVIGLQINNGALLACGDFNSIGGQSRNRIAELNFSNGLATNYNPDADNTVNSVAADQNFNGFLAGKFNSVGSEFRLRGASTSLVSSSVNNTWSPNTLGDMSNPEGIPNSIVCRNNGSRIYLGGDFESASGNFNRRFFAVYESVDNNVPNSIETQNVLQYPICTSGNFGVSYNANGIYNVGNIFTAELSDSTGGFTIPVAIGSITGISSGTILATVPVNATAGANYKIRVVSSNPPIVGSETLYNFTLGVTNTSSVTISASPTGPVCTGDSITFFANVTNPGSSYQYRWYKNGTTNLGGGANYTTNALVDSDFISLRYTNNDLCASPVTVYSDTIYVSIVDSIVPSINISSNPTFPICEGSAATFTSTVSGAGNNPAYEWSVNGVSSGVSSSTFSPAVLNNGDTVTCELISSASCAIPTTAISNFIIAAFNPLPNVTLNVTDTVCLNSGIILLSGGTPSGGIYSVAGVTGNNFDPQLAGIGYHDIAYNYTDSLGCNNNANDSILVDLCAGINEVSYEGFSLYPNPANSKFTLSFNNLINYGVVKIYNVLGEKILEELIFNSSSKEIDAKNISAGVYFIKLAEEEKQFSSKLIIMEN